jgi:glutaredoxin
MDIELLVVEDCPHQTAAARLIATAVADTGVKATITHTIIASEAQATQRGFTGSPTVLLNGTDPFAVRGAAVALACRVYSTPDGLRGVPGVRDLRRALKRAAAG